jgi:hypothetical protein
MPWRPLFAFFLLLGLLLGGYGVWQVNAQVERLERVNKSAGGSVSKPIPATGGYGTDGSTPLSAEVKEVSQEQLANPVASVIVRQTGGLGISEARPQSGGSLETRWS